MTLDISIHRTILFQILKDIYSDTSISPFLGFKGGTAALLFYGLDRFSVDLDFDLLDKNKAAYIFEQLQKIVQRYGILKEQYLKRYSLFCLLSYESQAHNIKIEVNRRQFGSAYEVKTFLGVSMLVMTKADMFAHKLVAMHERIGKTSRDIYDVWFFLTKRFPINKDILVDRTKQTSNEFILTCISQLQEMNNKHILTGVGELLTDSKKDWARQKLREETIALLHLRLEA